MKYNLETLQQITSRAFAQMNAMIYTANHRDNAGPGDPKVGGHPASCASCMDQQTNVNRKAPTEGVASMWRGLVLSPGPMWSGLVSPRPGQASHPQLMGQAFAASQMTMGVIVMMMKMMLIMMMMMQS